MAISSKKITKNPKYWYFISCISSLLLLFGLFRGINLPYVGYNAWNFTTYSLIAHNYNQFGYITSKFAPIISVSKEIPARPSYYLHHPQLLSFIQAIFFRYLGEHFWVGKLPVIFFSIGSFVLLFFIAQTMRNWQYGLIVVSIAGILPGTALFGRMIGQEPLVLFFCLAALYCLMQYCKTKHTLYHIFIYVSVVLGTLSDWPMVYFTGVLLLYVFFLQKITLGIRIFCSSVITAILFLLYIYWLQGNFSELFFAFTTRSFGTLVSYAYWPLLWISAISVRLIFYFNPVILAMSFIFLFKLYKQWRNNKRNIHHILICLLGVFALFHVLLYPEGSFGHPYWIYYFVPFIAFSSAEVVASFQAKKSLVFIFGIYIISIAYFLKLENWKTKEISSNVFRYELAKKADEVLKPYEKIAINLQSPIDYDLFRFPFLHEVIFETPKSIQKNTSIKHYIYTCSDICDRAALQELLSIYTYRVTQSSLGEQYVFFLNTKQKSDLIENSKKGVKTEHLSIVQPEYRNNIIKVVYSFLLTKLHMPQL